MTWEIFLGIASLAAFVSVFIKAFSNNTKAITELRCSIDMLKEEIADNKQCIHKLEGKVENHEGRITKLECK